MNDIKQIEAKDERVMAIFDEIATKALDIVRKYRKKIKNANHKFLQISQKPDNTLLTKADVEVQEIIVETIRSKGCHDASIIAEEVSACKYDPKNESTWVIDPIDGTAQFIDPDSREFCVVVCLLKKGMPSYAMILLPEIGKNSAPVTIVGLLEEKKLYVNGVSIDIEKESQAYLGRLETASVTRSKDELPHSFETFLSNIKCKTKTRTTSQTIDMLRSAVDMTPYSDVCASPKRDDETLYKFDLFYRKQQKIWDGAAGMCLNLIVGKKVMGVDSKDLLPFSEEFLSGSVPISETVIVADQHVLNDCDGIVTKPGCLGSHGMPIMDAYSYAKKFHEQYMQQRTDGYKFFMTLSGVIFAAITAVIASSMDYYWAFSITAILSLFEFVAAWLYWGLDFRTTGFLEGVQKMLLLYEARMNEGKGYTHTRSMLFNLDNAVRARFDHRKHKLIDFHATNKKEKKRIRAVLKRRTKLGDVIHGTYLFFMGIAALTMICALLVLFGVLNPPVRRDKPAAPRSEQRIYRQSDPSKPARREEMSGCR